MFFRLNWRVLWRFGIVRIVGRITRNFFGHFGTRDRHIWGVFRGRNCNHRCWLGIFLIMVQRFLTWRSLYRRGYKSRQPRGLNLFHLQRKYGPKRRASNFEAYWTRFHFWDQVKEDRYHKVYTYYCHRLLNNFRAHLFTVNCDVSKFFKKIINLLETRRKSSKFSNEKKTCNKPSKALYLMHSVSHYAH